MSSSLIIPGGYEVLGGAGPVFLMTGGDFGSPAPETAAVARILFDGDIVSGERTANRSVVLPLAVYGTSSAARVALVEAIAKAVDQPSSLLQFTPDGGNTVGIDCYRGSLQLDTNLLQEAQGWRTFTVTLPALPFVRDLSPQTLASAAAASSQLDSFDVARGSFTLDTATKAEGTGSNTATVPLPYSSTPPFGDTGVITFGTAKDLSTVPILTLKLLNVVSGTPKMTVTLTVKDTGGHAVSRNVYFQPVTDSSGFITTIFDFSTGWGTGFDPTHVASYQLQAFCTYMPSGSSLAVHVDDLRANSLTGGAITSPVNITNYLGVQGSYRTPVGITIDAGTAVSRLLIARAGNPYPGFSPVLPQPSTSGGSSGVIGAFDPGGGYKLPATWVIPATAYEGTYAVAVHCHPGAVGSVLTMTAQITGDSTFKQTVNRTVTAADLTAITGATYTILPFGEITLPPRAVAAQNTTSTITITMASTDSTTPTLIDQIYLLDLTSESLLIDLTQAQMASCRYFFLDPPGTTDFTGAIYGGNQANRSDAVSLFPALRGPAGLNFDPEANNLLTVTDNSGASVGTTTVSYYPLWAVGRPS